MKPLLSMVLALLSAILTVALPAEPSLAATTDDKINDYLRGNYYRIEFILFERNPGTKVVAGEKLDLYQPTRWPLNMMTMPADDKTLASAYALDLFTRTRFEWPLVEFTPATGDEKSFKTTSSPGLATATDNLDVLVAPIIQPELEPSMEEKFLTAVTAYEQNLNAASFQMFDHLELSSQARKLSRRHRVIFHGAWQQPIPNRDQPMGILFQPEPGLDGFFGITLGRYLHFQIDFWKKFTSYQAKPIDTPLNPRDPWSLRTTPAMIPETSYLHFQENRRMRSEELHYLDHPRFGILVKIDPIKVPEELVIQFKAFEQSKLDSDS